MKNKAKSELLIAATRKPYLKNLHNLMETLRQVRRQRRKQQADKELAKLGLMLNVDRSARLAATPKPTLLDALLELGD